jgi:hypothetical protein
MDAPELDIKVLNAWLSSHPNGEDLLVKAVPMSPSTLRQTKSGRYTPGPLLARRILDVIAQHPKSRKTGT